MRKIKVLQNRRIDTWIPRLWREVAPASASRRAFAYWMRRVARPCQRAGADLAPDPSTISGLRSAAALHGRWPLRAIDPDSSWKDMKKAGKSYLAASARLRDVQVMAEWVHEARAARRSGDRPSSTSWPDANMAEMLASRRSGLRRTAVAKWSRECLGRAARVKRRECCLQTFRSGTWTEASTCIGVRWRNRSQVAFHQLRIGSALSLYRGELPSPAA